MRALSFSHPVMGVHSPCIGNHMASQALDNTKSGSLVYRAFSSHFRVRSSRKDLLLQGSSELILYGK